ncbi:MAG: N-carbamoyl-D-amino-acid hydrolase [Alphaproteobacteria bacterium]|nr:N-carbamoyl-D-amino-acid hydrolase [Alphaproteobacteria bacterium]
MPRYLTVAAAQLGPVLRDEPRESVVKRLIALLEQGKKAGCELVVFPEMALTTFFPRWYMANKAETDEFFERAMPNDRTQPLFEAAARLGVGFYLGYCEMFEEGGRTRRFNSAVLVDQKGRIIGKYRKVHVPGNRVYDPKLPYQHMEPYYFEDGDLGFPVWQAFGTTVGMAICNDRRWPETYRVMALKGAELIVLGFNSPSQLPDWPDQNVFRVQHHLVCMQAAAYQNGLWIVASSKAGREEGVDMMGHSCIVAPSSDVVAVTQGLGDELIAYRCDLDLAPYYKSFFGFEQNRRPEHYGIITQMQRQRLAAQ